MWMTILLALLVTGLFFFLSLQTNPALFFSLRYIGLVPVILALAFLRPIFKANKQDRLPEFMKFRAFFALFAMISLFIAIIAWCIFGGTYLFNASVIHVALVVLGITMLAMQVSFLVERTHPYYSEVPDVMNTINKARKVYEEAKNIVEYRRDTFSYYCAIYQDLFGSQITGFLICDAQGRLVPDLHIIEQVGKAVNLSGQYHKKYQMVESYEENLERIETNIAETNEFLKEFSNLERTVYPDEDFYAIWYEINEHAEKIIKHALYREKLTCQNAIEWLEDFEPESYISEQDIQNHEAMLLSACQEVEPLDAELMDHISTLCHQFIDEISDEDLNLDRDIVQFNIRNGYYVTRVLNLIITVIEKARTNTELQGISFNEIEKELLNEKMKMAQEKKQF